MLDITKFMHELKTKNPKIYAELIKIHYIKQLHYPIMFFFGYIIMFVGNFTSVADERAKKKINKMS